MKTATRRSTKTTDRECASKIIHYHEKGEQRQYESLVCFKRAGDWVIRAQDEVVPSRTWGRWVKDNLPITEQHAGRYRRLSENWELVEPKIGQTVFSLTDADKFIAKLNQPPPGTLQADDGRFYRECLLNRLEALKPGLHLKAIIPQSDCFVFAEGKAFTYNDEMSCTVDCDLGITGAVPATPLLKLLAGLREKTVTIEQDERMIFIEGRGREAGIPFQEDILSQFDQAVDKPKKWRPLHEDFCEAVKTVAPCASTDAMKFIQTCIHCHPEFVQACDNYQFCRWPMKTGFKNELLVRADSLKHVAEAGVSEFSETKNWLHFRNASGLEISCRLSRDEYPDLDNRFEIKGETQTVEFPSGFKKAIENAEIFSSTHTDSNCVTVSVRRNKLILKGEGDSGWYKEQFACEYGGVAIEFIIPVEIVRAAVGRTNQFQICGPEEESGKHVYSGKDKRFVPLKVVSGKRIHLNGDGFKYVAILPEPA